MKWKPFIGIALSVALASCETVQYTGRSQLNLISDSQEKRLGADAYQDVLKKTPLSARKDWQAGGAADRCGGAKT